MFSDNSVKTAKACRYCWMCRHICPVSNNTAMEAWGPRTRGFLVSLIERGKEFDEVIAEDMYMCCLCDACADDCASGYKPKEFILEARTEAIARDIVPANVAEAMAKFNKTGNVWGSKMSAKVKKEVEAMPEKAKVLLWLGQTASTKAADTALAAISILKKAKVDFTVLKNEPESGVMMSEYMGYTGEVQEAAKKAAKAIEATGAKTVVALDPHDACIFTEKYAEWNLAKGVTFVTATSYIAGLIKDKKLKVKAAKLDNATYSDPCRLARGIGETDAAREIISALGIDMKEMLLNRNLSRCCGGPILNSYAPEVVEKMVATRTGDAVRMGYKNMITSCPGCQYIMSSYNKDVKFVDLYKLVDENC